MTFCLSRIIIIFSSFLCFPFDKRLVDFFNELTDTVTTDHQLFQQRLVLSSPLKPAAWPSQLAANNEQFSKLDVMQIRKRCAIDRPANL